MYRVNHKAARGAMHGLAAAAAEQSQRAAAMASLDTRTLGTGLKQAANGAGVMPGTPRLMTRWPGCGNAELSHAENWWTKELFPGPPCSIERRVSGQGRHGSPCPGWLSMPGAPAPR